MSYQKCNLCHERYKGVHLCKPEWETESLWKGEFSEDVTVRANDAEEAAEQCIAMLDDGTEERVRVRLLGSSDQWQVFDVASEDGYISAQAVTE